jgi:ketosteroid isomerase-like protein
MKAHVETVRLSILTFAEHGLDIDALTPLWSFEAEWDLTQFEDWSGGVCRGPGEILAMVGQWLGQFSTYELTIDDLQDHGDHVLALLRHRGRLRGSGDSYAADDAQLYTLRVGRIVRVQSFSDRAAASAALGG